MAKPILSSDLYKDEGDIREAIESLIKMKETYVDLSETVAREASDMSDAIRGSNVVIKDNRTEFNKLAKKVDDLVKRYDSYKSTISGIDSELRNLTKAQQANAAATAATQKRNNGAEDSIKSMRAAMRSATRQLELMSKAERTNSVAADSLRKTIANLKAEIDLETKARKDAAQIIKLQTIANKAEEGSAEQLSAQYRILTIQIRQMSAANRLNTDEGQKAVQKAREIADALKAEQAARGRNTLSVGDYAGAIAGALSRQQGLVNQLRQTEAEFKRLPLSVRRSAKAQEYHSQVVSELRSQIASLQTVTGRQLEANTRAVRSNNRLVASLRNIATVYFSVSRAGELFNRVFADTKKLDALNLAYEKTIPNLRENAQTQQFLAETAEKYGTNILTLRKAYLRFNAASASSNLTMQAQQKIFDSVSKAAAVLGLEASKTDRVFNALEQILSKGTVSAEELRQQLGDSLPGSMEIMAKALGVTTLELSKMIEKGEVLAEDALPKFAAQLEKAYGIEGVNRVDNLTAAQGRFETAVVDLIDELDASSAFTDFYDTLRNGIVFIRENLSAFIQLGKALFVAVGAYAGLRLSIITITKATALLNTAIQISRGLLLTYPIGIIAVGATAAALAIINLSDSMGGLLDVQSELAKISNEYQKDLAKEKAQIDNLFESIKDTSIPMEERISLYNKLQRLYPNYLDNIDLEKTSLGQLEDTQKRLNKTIEQSLALRIRSEKIAESEARELEARAEIIELRATKGSELSLLDIAANDDAFSSDLPAREEAANNIIAKKEEEIRLEKEIQDQIRATYGIIASGETRADRIRAASLQGFYDTNEESSASPSGSSRGGNIPTGDPFAEALLRANALEDGLEKELELLRINNEKKKIEFAKYGIETTLLTEKYARDRQGIYDKYNAIELEKADDAEQERIDLIEDRIERDIAQLEFDTERYARHVDDKLLVDEFYAREYAKIQKRIDAQELARLKEAESDRKAAYEDSLADFQLSQEIALANRSNTGQSPLEDKKFEVRQEAETIKYVLDNNEDLSPKEREALDAKLRALFREYDDLLEGRSDDERDIYDLLGINVDDATKDALATALNFAKDQWKQFADFRKQVADQNVRQANREVTSAENALQRQIDARDNQQAHNVAAAEAELARTKKIQAEALKEQRAAQKEQQAIQSIEQATNLATASTTIFRQVGNPLVSIPLIGLMLAAFATAKIRARNLTREYADGTYEEFDYGGSHKSGNDIPLGMTRDGKERRVERGESMMILPKKATSKYKSILPQLYKDLKSGDFDPSSMDMSRDGDVNYWTNSTEVNTDSLVNYFKGRDRKRSKNNRSVVYANGVEIITKGKVKTYIHG